MIRIGPFEIGAAGPFLIAEAGINHNGSLERAFAMIDAAKHAGANAVKFQTFSAERFVTDRTSTYTYRSRGVEVTEPMIDLFRRHEFKPEEWAAIKRHCDRAGIIFLSTPQDRPDLDLLLEIGIPAIKIGSDDFNNLPLVRDYAKTGLPLILSCGMAHMGEVHATLEAAGAFDQRNVVLLLCTSQYPTPPEDANMRRLQTLSAAYPDTTLGFSDHTQGIEAACLAVAMGAVVFEKHFTLDNNLAGPDHWFSENPTGLGYWVNAIRNATAMMGSRYLRPTSAEAAVKKIARRSIVTAKDIAAGSVLDLSNLSLKRPGTGLPPALLDTVTGRVAARDLSAGTLLSWSDLR